MSVPIYLGKFTYFPYYLISNIAKYLQYSEISIILIFKYLVLNLSACLSACVSLCLWVCLTVCVSACVGEICLSVYMSIWLCISVFLRPSACLCVRLRVCVSVCLPACLHMSIDHKNEDPNCFIPLLAKSFADLPQPSIGNEPAPKSSVILSSPF